MSNQLSHLLKSEFAKHHLSLLNEIPDPPKEIWYEGKLPPNGHKLLAVVGSRQYTTYGSSVIDKLIPPLSDYPIGIISGLALGIDALAHEAALNSNIYTLAVPGSGLDRQVLYPASNKNLAERILEHGGGLLSEYEALTSAAPWTFPRRNRIMVGLTHATLMIEAGEKSGTLITARLAADYNRELLAVPGSIFSKNSYGVHQFIKLGATVVTEPEDILLALGFEAKQKPTTPKQNLSKNELLVIDILRNSQDRDSLIRLLKLPAEEATTLLMQMEINGYIKYSAPHYISLI